MKKIVIVLFLGLCTQLGFSQTYQFKTVNYSVSQKMQKANGLNGLKRYQPNY